MAERLEHAALPLRAAYADSSGFSWSIMMSIRRAMDTAFIILVILVVLYLSVGGYVIGYVTARIHKWPTDADDAVALVISRLDEKQKAEFAAMPRDQLIELHFGLGMAIRNDFGLWGGNIPLLESACGDSHYCDPDDVSFEIIKRTWEKLQREKRAVAPAGERRRGE